MTKPWLRLYVELLDDPKIQQMSAKNFKILINLWCVSQKFDGLIPSIKDVGFGLRVTEKKAAAIMNTFLEAGLFERKNNGFTPHGWEQRQYQSDSSTERVKRFRERFRNVPGNGPETETETETDIKKEKVIKKEKGFEHGENSKPGKPRRARATLEKPESVQDSTWRDFLFLRKSKKAPLTETALAGIQREAEKAKISLDEALAVCCRRGWQGFESEWFQRQLNGNGSAPLGQCPKRFHPPGSTKLKTCGKPGVELVGKYAFCQDHLEEAQKGALSHG